MSQPVPKSYTKRDYLLQLKEVQDKINLEKVRFEKLERDNTEYETNLKAKKKKNKELFEKENRQMVELEEKKTLLSNHIDQFIRDIKGKGEMLRNAEVTLEKCFESLYEVQEQVRVKKEEADQADKYYKTKMDQIQKDIDKKNKERSLIVVQDMKIEERSSYLDSREESLGIYNEGLTVKEQMLINKERVLKRYIYRLKLKFPDVEIKHI